VTPPSTEVFSKLPAPPAPEWVVAAPPDPVPVKMLASELNLPPALCRILVARGVVEPDAARSFLRPLLDHLHPPELLTDARRAADRILTALDRDETILVHGDYDVDGVCSTALLTLWLRELGGRVVPFIPHRMRDGYDLGPAGLEAAEAAQASLLVTCDSGISAHDAVARARASGIDVIITDHHTPGPTLPAAIAVLNPAREDCTYPERSLAGVGVAFKLCQLLARLRGRPTDALLPYLDLVALATVADLVPLKGENRVLVRYGLRVLNETSRPGLQALRKVTGLEGKEVDSGKVGFVLAPRINAAGRMGAADRALELLLADDPVRARALAEELEELNGRRRAEDRRTLDEVLESLTPVFDPAEDFGLVVDGQGWHPGVIGIVASRVVERVHRPVVLLTTAEGRARGSARSIPGVHLYQALKACSEHLTRFGGHRQAAGMEMEPGRIPAFRKCFNRVVREQLDGATPRPRARADVALPLGEATDDLHHLIQYLGPFGMGNPRPVFFARGLEVAGEAREVGRGHLKLRLREGGSELDAIGFDLAVSMPPDRVGRGPVDALFQLRENEFRGVRSLQARLLDLRPSQETS